MNAGVYLRVSTRKQDEENQEPDCARLCEARGWSPVWYREQASGAKRRPEWDRLLEACRVGQLRAVVFWAVDRTGRNKVQIAHDLSELLRWGAVVASVKDAWLDTAPGPMRDHLIDVMAWVAEGERIRLIERINAGLTRARAKGVKLGRPPAEISGMLADEARALRAQGMSWPKVLAALRRKGWGAGRDGWRRFSRWTIARAVNGAKPVAGYAPPAPPPRPLAKGEA